MDCAKAHKLISPHLDGELSPTEQVALAAHLHVCASCRAVAGDLGRQHQLLAGMEKFAAPVGFHTRVMANLDSPPATGIWWLRIVAGVVEVAVLGVIIFTGIVSGTFLAERLAPGKTPGVTASLALDLFDPAPPDSLGGVYLAMTEVPDEK